MPNASAPATPPSPVVRWLTDVFLRPNIRRDIIIGFLLLILGGLAIMLVTDKVFERQTDFLNLVNTAGRLRMLSQRIAYIAHQEWRNPSGPGDARAELPLLIERFDADLAELGRVSTAMGIFAANESTEGLGLDAVAKQWQGYRSAAATIASQPIPSAEAVQAIAYIEQHAQTLLETADNNVRHIVAHSIADRAWLGVLMYAMLLTGVLLLVAAFVYIRRRLLRPFSAISRMAERLASGDLGARAASATHDEVGRLITRLNATADVMQDLFDNKARVEDTLRESEARSRMVLEASHDAILVTDAQGIISYANHGAEVLFGYAPGELLGTSAFDLYPERNRAAHRVGMEQLVNCEDPGGGRWPLELSALHKSGREIRVELSANHLRVRAGDLFTAFYRDLTARNAMLADLNLRNRAIESTGEGVMITDALSATHPIIYVNPAFERITGYRQDETLGRSGRMLIGGDLMQPEVEALRQILRERREGTVTLHCLKKDGSRFWNELSAAPVRDRDGTVTHYISIFKDVTERRAQMEEMLRWTHHDMLTGLPNRVLFQDRLQQAIASAARREHLVGVLFIDLDGFKTVNDTLGHNAGDGLLREAAHRLQACVRDGDTVARIGGDEFVMLLNEVEGDYGIEPVAERALAALSKSFALDGREVFVGASIGTSIFPRDAQEGEALVRNADLAMYRAKANGRNNVQAYSAEMHSQRERWVTIESKLRRAVDRGDFLLHYQPQMALSNGRIVGAEALVRWHDPDMGLVPPSQFIALAEEIGLIGAIGEWVLHHACQQVKAWRQQGVDAPRIAVNISARQFRQPNLFKLIERSLDNHGLEAFCLEVELTESMVMHDPERTIGVLRQMREAGLHLSLDDFGTGYSSLSYLRRFPLDVLKVDQSFIREVTSNEEAAAIAGAIITLAHSLNLCVVAEGVETAEQLDFMIAQRCDVIQGFYFSKPLPADQFGAFFLRNQRCETKLVIG